MHATKSLRIEQKTIATLGMIDMVQLVEHHTANIKDMSLDALRQLRDQIKAEQFNLATKYAACNDELRDRPNNNGNYGPY